MIADKKRKLLRALCPQIPFADAERILKASAEKAKIALPPSINLWLTLIAYIRHQHTEYDKLLAEGYDRDAARHFTRDEINAVLKRWGCQREMAQEDENAL